MSKLNSWLLCMLWLIRCCVVLLKLLWLFRLVSGFLVVISFRWWNFSVWFNGLIKIWCKLVRIWCWVGVSILLNWYWIYVEVWFLLYLIDDIGSEIVLMLFFGCKLYCNVLLKLFKLRFFIGKNVVNWVK